MTPTAIPQFGPRFGMPSGPQAMMRAPQPGMGLGQVYQRMGPQAATPTPPPGPAGPGAGAPPSTPPGPTPGPQQPGQPPQGQTDMNGAPLISPEEQQLMQQQIQKELGRKFGNQGGAMDRVFVASNLSKYSPQNAQHAPVTDQGGQFGGQVGTVPAGPGGMQRPMMPPMMNVPGNYQPNSPGQLPPERFPRPI
jgi:hypothetical protein